MPALSNTGGTTVTDRQAQGPIPDTSPPNGSTPTGGGGTGTVTSITAGTGLTGGVITTAGTIALANTAVTPGAYSNANITVDQQGRITSASNGSSGGGGTVTSVAAGTGLTGGTITSSGTIALANTAVTPGSYTLASITVDQQGRITAASSGSAGAGTVTSVATGTGLTGGTITSSGTISLASIANNTVLGNVSGGTAAPAATTPTSLLDNVFGNAQGNVLYRGASVWAALAPGTAGQFLKTNGAGSNPAWASPAGAGTVTSVGVSGANGIGVSGSPITGSGTIALSLGDISSATSKPAVTGSVARTLASARGDVFDVKDFGAVGNGAADDTSAVQAALTAAGLLAYSGVYFPPGIYKVTDKLTFANASGSICRLAIFGEGPAASKILVAGGSGGTVAKDGLLVDLSGGPNAKENKVYVGNIGFFASSTVDSGTALEITYGNQGPPVNSFTGPGSIVDNVDTGPTPGFLFGFKIGVLMRCNWFGAIRNVNTYGHFAAWTDASRSTAGIRLESCVAVNMANIFVSNSYRGVQYTNFAGDDGGQGLAITNLQCEQHIIGLDVPLATAVESISLCGFVIDLGNSNQAGHIGINLVAASFVQITSGTILLDNGIAALKADTCPDVFISNLEAQGVTNVPGKGIWFTGNSSGKISGYTCAGFTVNRQVDAGCAVVIWGEQALVSWNPGTIAAGAQASTDFAYAGARFGQGYVVGAPYDLQHALASVTVPSADTLRVTVYNATGSGINLVNGDWIVTRVG